MLDWHTDCRLRYIVDLQYAYKFHKPKKFAAGKWSPRAKQLYRALPDDLKKIVDQRQRHLYRPVNKRSTTIDIQIDDDTLALLNKTAEDRLKYKMIHRAKNMRISKMDDTEVLLIGLRGEYALSKFLGISNKASLRHSKGGDRGFDFAVNGNTIEIKTTRTPLLIINKDYRKLKSDVVVDAQDVAPDKIRFRGWATREEFYNKCYDREYRYKDANGCKVRDVMDPEDLNPMETLKEYLDAREDTEMGEQEVP